MSGINKIATSIRLDEEIHKKLKEISEIEKRSFNLQVEYAIEFFVREYERVNGLKK